MANIVIYGAEISGICAAIKARGNLLADNQEHNIKIIVTNPSGKIGGLATVGGLNCWDIFHPAGYDNCCQGGSFAHLMKTHLQSYKVLLEGETDEERINNPDTGIPSIYYQKSMDLILEDMLAPVTKNDTLKALGITNDKVTIEIIRAMDIVDIDFTTDESGNKTIEKLYLRSIYRSDDGYIRWGRKTRVVEGDYFIDSSDDGKLTSALNKVTVGRYDWPANSLDACEKTNIPVARQQVATLYFRVKNLDGIINDYGYNTYIPSGGGDEVNTTTNNAYKYNMQYESEPHLLKKYNIAKNSHYPEETEYWVNTLVLFNVDGRAHYRDFTSKYYPKYMLSDSIHRDEAWVYGRSIVSGANKKEDKLSFVDGFSGFNIVANSNTNTSQNTPNVCVSTFADGSPVVAEQLYIRESVHLPLYENAIVNGSENLNYAIIPNESITGNDSNNMNTRIGVATYSIDVHPYKKEDIFKSEGYLTVNTDHDKLLDMMDSVYQMRSDLKENYSIRPDGYLPPVHVPFETIYTDRTTNLLVVGNAASISSLSWGEMRVLPNLCLLGDAAGIALAYCIRKNKELSSLNTTNNIQITTDSGTEMINDFEYIRSIGKLLNDNMSFNNELWWSNGFIVDKPDNSGLFENSFNRDDYNPDNYFNVNNAERLKTAK